jgi:protein-tyrosine phosphatase
MNLDNPLGRGSGKSTPRGPGYYDPSTLNEDERRIATELSTALATTTYEIRDKLSEVMPGLFLSNGQVAQDLPMLRAQRISHVLNMAPIEVPTTAEFYAEEKMDFKAIVAKDEFDYDVMQHWPEARAYLDAALNEQNGRVLVHCQAGINRSGAIAVAYMMVTRRRHLVDAAKSAKRKRYQLITNLNFQLSLVKFASAEGLLGKPALPRRMSSPNPYPGSPIATRLVFAWDLRACAPRAYGGVEVLPRPHPRAVARASVGGGVLQSMSSGGSDVALDA